MGLAGRILRNTRFAGSGGIKATIEACERYDAAYGEAEKAWTAEGLDISSVEYQRPSSPVPASAAPLRSGNAGQPSAEVSQRQLDSLSKQVEDANQQANKLRSELDQARAELAKLQKSSLVSTSVFGSTLAQRSGKISDLELQLARAERDQRAQLETLKATQQALTSAEAEKTMLSGQVVALQRDVANLSDTNKALTASVQAQLNLEKAYNEQQGTLTHLREQLATLSAELSQTKAELTVAQADLTQLQNQEGPLREANEQMSRAMAEGDSERQQLKEQLAQLQAVREQDELAVSNAQSKLAELETRIRSLGNEQQKLVDENSALQEAIKEKDTKAGIQAQQLTQYKVQLSESEALAKQLGDLLADEIEQEQGVKLREAMDQQAKRHSEAAADWEQLNKIHETTRTQLVGQLRAMREASAPGWPDGVDEPAGVTVPPSPYRPASAQLLAEKDDTIKALQAELDQLKARALQPGGGSVSPEAGRVAAQIELAQMKARNAELERELTQKAEETYNLTQKNGRLQTGLQTKQQELEESNGRVQGLRTSKQEIEARLEALEKDMMRLKTRNQALEQSNESLTRKNEDLSLELARAKLQIQRADGKRALPSSDDAGPSNLREEELQSAAKEEALEAAQAAELARQEALALRKKRDKLEQTVDGQSQALRAIFQAIVDTESDSVSVAKLKEVLSPFYE